MLLGLGLSITVFLSTALLTWAWIKIALAKEIVDRPERRRLHERQIPRAGGISIALVMIFATALYSFSREYPGPYWYLVLAAIVLYGLLGFLDDLKPMGPGRKLFLHLAATLALFLIAWFLLKHGPFLAIVIALGYLLFVNIWNFMDGSNGMIGMQSLVCAAGFLVLGNSQGNTHDFALILTATCLGFLPFNFPEARVFLGDVGSHVLGAAIVGLSLLAYAEGAWTLLEILCLTTALWVDAVSTFIRRFFRGYEVTHAHRSHLYQYAIRSGKSHAAICLLYAAWTVFAISVIGFGRQIPETSQRILLLALIAVACVLHQWLRLFVLKSVNSPKKPKLIS